MIVVAEGINTDKFQISENGVAMNIHMSPIEALGGFMREEQLFDGQWIRVDRRGKLTLPGKEILLLGLGWPAINDESHSRKNILVRFELNTVKSAHIRNFEELVDNDREEIRKYMDKVISQVDIEMQNSEHSSKFSDVNMRLLIHYLLVEEIEWKERWK